MKDLFSTICFILDRDQITVNNTHTCSLVYVMSTCGVYLRRNLSAKKHKTSPPPCFYMKYELSPPLNGQ